MNERSATLLSFYILLIVYTATHVYDTETVMPSSLKTGKGIFEEDDEDCFVFSRMFDLQIQGKEKSGAVPDYFLPYGSTQLTKDLIEFARENLNETDETRRRGLEELREFLRKEVDVQYEMGESMLLCFLRARKFDVQRTCTLFKRAADFVESYREIFERVDNDIVNRIVTAKFIGFLPYRDAKGRAILYLRVDRWKTNEFNADEIIYGSMVAVHSAIDNHINQVAGYVVIIDCKNMSLNHIISLSTWLIFGVQALQRCLPALVKEFHIVHTPAVFRTLWKVVKPLLSEKIRKRITIYKSSHWDSLHRNIPPCLLPEELGGQLGPYTYDHWATDIPSMCQKYHDKCQTFLNRKKN